MSTAKVLRGTVRPAASFNAEQDVMVIRTACKGIGTDEASITHILVNRSNAQRQEIKTKYRTAVGKDIETELSRELSFNYCNVVLGLFKTPLDYDVDELHRAIQGAGTDEDALIEILATSSNSEIAEIKAAYKRKFKRDLQEDIVGDTSGYFKRLMVSLCTGARSEDQTVDMEQVRRDAQNLFKAGEQKLGTDESAFILVFGSRSKAHIAALDVEYGKISKRGLKKAIKSEMSGDLRDGLLGILHASINKQQFIARNLHDSMKGLGTRDARLIRNIIRSCEVDMVQVKEEFQRHYGKTLESYIKGDTSGDYMNILLGLVGA